MTAQPVTWYAARGMSSRLLLLLMVLLQPQCCSIFTTGECDPAKRRHLPSANTCLPATISNIAGDDCCVCSTTLAPAGGQRGTKQLSATCVSCWKIASGYLCDVAQEQQSLINLKAKLCQDLVGSQFVLSLVASSVVQMADSTSSTWPPGIFEGVSLPVWALPSYLISPLQLALQVEAARSFFA